MRRVVFFAHLFIFISSPLPPVLSFLLPLLLLLLLLLSSSCSRSLFFTCFPSVNLLSSWAKLLIVPINKFKEIKCNNEKHLLLSDSSRSKLKHLDAFVVMHDGK